MGNEMQGGLEEAGHELERAGTVLRDVASFMSELEKVVGDPDPAMVQKVPAEKREALKEMLSSRERAKYVAEVQELLEKTVTGTLKGVLNAGGAQAMARECFKNGITGDINIEELGYTVDKLLEAPQHMAKLAQDGNLRINSITCDGCSPVKCTFDVTNLSSADLEVGIPPGFVLEQQEDAREEQTVCTPANELMFILKASERKSFTVDGYCVNPHEKRPDMSPMNATALRFKSVEEVDEAKDIGVKQKQIWAQVEDIRKKMKAHVKKHEELAATASAAGF